MGCFTLLVCYMSFCGALTDVESSPKSFRQGGLFGWLVQWLPIWLGNGSILGASTSHFQIWINCLCVLLHRGLVGVVGRGIFETIGGILSCVTCEENIRWMARAVPGVHGKWDNNLGWEGICVVFCLRHKALKSHLASGLPLCLTNRGVTSHLADRCLSIWCW